MFSTVTRTASEPKRTGAASYTDAVRQLRTSQNLVSMNSYNGSFATPRLHGLFPVIGSLRILKPGLITWKYNYPSYTERLRSIDRMTFTDGRQCLATKCLVSKCLTQKYIEILIFFFFLMTFTSCTLYRVLLNKAFFLYLAMPLFFLQIMPGFQKCRFVLNNALYLKELIPLFS